MQILHPFWDRFLNDFWSILAPKMEPKWTPNLMFSGSVFFYTLFWFCGRCFLKFSHVFASCYDVIFDAEHCVFMYFFLLCTLQDQLKERSQTLQKSNPKWSKNQCKIVPKSTPKSIFFWTPFGDAWRPRFWAGFGVDLGSILGPFWGQKSVWKRLEKSSKKWLEKSHAPHPSPTQDAWPVVL